MDEKIHGRLGDFQSKTPEFNDIPEFHVRCMVCNADIPWGIISIGKHNSECGGKEQYDKAAELGKRFRNKEITAEELETGLKQIYDIPWTVTNYPKFNNE